MSASSVPYFHMYENVMIASGDSITSLKQNEFPGYTRGEICRHAYKTFLGYVLRYVVGYNLGKR
jgi:hypothetical protein